MWQVAAPWGAPPRFRLRQASGATGSEADFSYGVRQVQTADVVDRVDRSGRSGPSGRGKST